MEPTYFILGRQPALGLAELESLFGSQALRLILPNVAELSRSVEPQLFTRLGGSIKMARLLNKQETTDWQTGFSALTAKAGEHAAMLPKGKLTVGISAYGYNVAPKAVNASALSLKKVIRAGDSGRSVRIVPNNNTKELNSAQVLHNNLLGSHGWELLFIRDGRDMIMAQTTALQDIEAYAARDQMRPKRDAQVGMLPPKLAQILINLAGNNVIPDKMSEMPEGSRLSRLLDPFCGTGVVLQEALLMGFDTYGTDLEARMIEYSETNLDWLTKRRTTAGAYTTEVGDATSYHWQGTFDLIATESYLGRPFSSTPSPEVLNTVMNNVDTIHKKFLRNVAAQTKPGFRMCVAAPAWKTSGGFRHLKSLASLEELGYNRLSFVHARSEDLIYHREGQVVARELVVLQRK